MSNNSNNTYQFPKKKNVNIRRKVQKPYAQKMLYSFESFDAFCDFCTFMNKTNYKSELSDFAKFASLYEYNSNYYLNLTGINLDTNLLEFLCPIITEFAHFVDNPELFERQITEYRKTYYKRKCS